MHYISDKKTGPANQCNPIWWNALGDPVLTNLIYKAVQGNNLDIQKAHDKVLAARATLGITSADLSPQLNESGKVSRDHLSANSEILSAIPGRIPYNYTDYKGGFDASWELDVFGGRRRAVEAANARWQSALEQQENVSITTAAEVARSYVKYRVFQQRIIIAQRTIDSYSKTAKLVQLQVDAGSGTGLDQRRIDSEVLSAKSVLPSLEAEARAALSSLAVLLGEYPENLYQTLNRTMPIPVVKTNILRVGLPSDLLKQRPDIRVAERELAAASADVGVATANLYPRFQLVGNIGVDTVLPGTFSDAASRYWSWGPQISIPIFQRGRFKNAVKRSEADYNVALANYKQTVLQGLADVESSLIRYDKERVRRRSLLASLNKIKSAEKLVNIQYRDGQATLNDVLDVERQVDQVNDQYVQSQGQDVTNLISLYKALGGSWS